MRPTSRPRRSALLGLAVLALLACGEAGRVEAQREPPARARAGAPARDEPPQQRGDTVDLRAIGYDRGAGNAPVLVVEFSDFGCPYCGRFALETFPEIEREFIRSGKVAWKYVPYVLGIFPNGDRAARAAECAAEQGDVAFWAMHDLLYERQREWKSQGGDARGLFGRYAEELRLDAARLLACYDEGRRGDRIERHTELGRRLGIRATPTFFINGVRLEGAIPIDAFRVVLERAAGGA